MIAARAVLPAIAWLAIAIPAESRTVQDGVPAQPEAHLVSEAKALEAAGDYEGAMDLLGSILRRNPTSLSALLSFERVAALLRRTGDLLPVLDTLIALEPASVIGHQMRVRALSLLNDEAGLVRAAESWIRAMPTLEVPYREVARVWRSRGSVDRAVAVLERGRGRVGRPDALALELGDAYAAAGDYGRVVEAWARAIGPKGEAFLLVQRRLANLPGAGAAVIPGLVDSLAAGPASPARKKAAVQLALEAGLDQRAQGVAAELLPMLPDVERRAFMVELARRADGAGLRRLALWAYGRIVSEGGREERLLPVRSRMAELALALGDTVGAERTYREIEGDLAPGSPERRQAMSLRVQMLAREEAFDSAAAQLGRLVEEPGGGAEADIAAAVLANALIDAGHPRAAERVLRGLQGPHVRFARGRVFMTVGDIDRARGEILASAPQLEGAEATEAISVAALLGRLSETGGALMGRGLAAIAAGDDHEGIMLLYDGSEGLPERERAAILDFAAGVADRIGLTAEADQVRRDIVEETPRAPEAPLALLSLARSQLERGSAAEAKLLLERLLAEYPRSALVPQARHEMERAAVQRLES